MVRLTLTHISAEGSGVFVQLSVLSVVVEVPEPLCTQSGEAVICRDMNSVQS